MRPCSLSCGRGHDASHGPPLRGPERRFEDAGAFAFVYIPCVFVISFWNLLFISFLRIVALHFLSLSCLVPLPFCPFPAFHICPFSTHAQPIPAPPLTQPILSYTPILVHYFLTSHLRLTLPLAHLKPRKSWITLQFGGTYRRLLL